MGLRCGRVAGRGRLNLLPAMLAGRRPWRLLLSLLSLHCLVSQAVAACSPAALGPWQRVGPCSEPCGGGLQLEVRAAMLPPAKDNSTDETGTVDTACAPLVRMVRCNSQPCR